MCSRAQCQRYVGRYVRFQSPYGYHEGVIERVSGNNAIVLSPRKYIPTQFASEIVEADEERRLDLALAWGAGGYGGRYGGGYAGRGGYGGYGGWGAYGWGRWAVSFLIIYALWGLWW